MVALLDALATYSDPVSLKELSKVSGLHPSTAHRILNDMVITRFVDRVEPGTYRLGMRLLELGNVVKSRLSVREAALDFMRALHKKTQQTINLSVRQGDEIVYIDRAFSERSGMQVVRAIGGRGPLHLTSTGKLFLSVDDPKAIRSYATRTGLAGHNKNSITDLAKLERELSLVRSRGYARDNEELELGVRCMAAGIHDDTRQADRRAVDFGAGRPAAGRMAGRPGADGQPDFGDAGLHAGVIRVDRGVRRRRETSAVYMTNQPTPGGLSASSQRRMRPASAVRDCLPLESRNTMITARPWIIACITRQRPASLMKPVFCRPMSQSGLATR